MRPDYKEISHAHFIEAMACEGQGWYPHPKNGVSENKIAPEYQLLFGSSKKEGFEEALRERFKDVDVIREEIQGRLEASCIVTGIKIGELKGHKNEFDALKKLSRVRMLISGTHEPDKTTCVLNMLPELEMLMMSVFQDGYKTPDHVKQVIMIGEGVGFDNLPRNVESLIMYHDRSPRSPLKGLNQFSKLKNVTIMNGEDMDAYGGLDSGSDLISGSPYEASWRKLRREVPGVHFDFSHHDDTVFLLSKESREDEKRFRLLINQYFLVLSFIYGRGFYIHSHKKW